MLFWWHRASLFQVYRCVVVGYVHIFIYTYKSTSLSLMAIVRDDCPATRSLFVMKSSEIIYVFALGLGCAILLAGAMGPTSLANRQKKPK